MSHIVEHIQRLQQRQIAPIQGIIGATGLGREAAQLRAATEAPGRILGPGDVEKSLADTAIAELDLTIWESSLTSTQRAAGAWALGQIGGLQPARKLLARLEAIFVHI